MRYILSACLLFFLQMSAVIAQDNLEAMLDSMNQKDEINYTTATFKSSRVINLHSVEKVAKGALEFRISHRFGAINGGSYQFFGLDQATIRLGLEYGVNDWLMIGVGRSSFEKAYDAFLKANLTRQSTGKKNMPVSILYFSSLALNSLKWADPNRNNLFSSRLAYTQQFIIGRKFNERFSLQLSPTWVHRNLVATTSDLNDIFAVGIAGRIKITRSLSLNGEYIYRMPTDANSPSLNNYYNSFSIGVDLETGGHVFQLHFSNSLAMIEKGFIAETNQDWLNGGIHFGFNITREFSLNKKKRMNW